MICANLGGGSMPRRHIAVLGTGVPIGRDERPCCASRRTSSTTVDLPRLGATRAARPTPDVRVIVTDEERCALPCDTRRSRQSCRRDLRKGSGDAAVITSHLRALLVHAGRGAGASGAAAGRGPGTAPAGAR